MKTYAYFNIDDDALDYYEDCNVFKMFDFFRWVPHEFMKHIELTEYGDTLKKFEQNPTIERSLAICWQSLDPRFLYFSTPQLISVREKVVEADYHWTVFGELFDAILTNQMIGWEIYDESSPFQMRMEGFAERYEAQSMERQRACLNRLSDLVANMKASFEPDGYLLKSDAIIFTHLSVGLILLLERIEKRQSERQEELIADALRILKTPRIEHSWYEDNEFMLSIETSAKLAELLLWSKLAQSNYVASNHERVLKCARNAYSLCKDADDFLYDVLSDEDESMSSPDVDDWFVGALHGTYPALETRGVGYHLVEFILPMETTVEAFDILLDEDSRGTDLKQLAEFCRFFRDIEAPFLLRSRHTPEEEFSNESWYTDARESWNVARGIVVNKMRSDDRIKELRRDADYKIEDRLRLYFFGDAWDRLPHKARAALTSADREYENGRGRRQGIFEDLWLATREVLVEVLLKPYNAFAASQKELKSFAALAPAPSEHKDLPQIVQNLFYAPLFEDYLKQSFNDIDKSFIKELEKPFGKLNKLRNDAVHADRAAYRRNEFDGEVHETYAEFLGVGRPGILPGLMRLHSKSKPHTV